MRCPSCKMESPDGAVFCDFCKEPFAKKAKPAPAKPAGHPLAGLSVDQLFELPAEQLLKEERSVPILAPWIRPLAWAFLAVWAVGGSIALYVTYAQYKKAQAEAAPRP